MEYVNDVYWSEVVEEVIGQENNNNNNKFEILNALIAS